ncbi:uncharacterized protein LOC127281496 [Leptopilina boulardi]|uniref:uncharacterized protein LOC127281496 n=1 Tax=Leptopilina boulardi TaxID=63433 RepID=UPI0021F580CA|nr:uncharacterized protein LOC127281496 [Leptopilina boulardi]
MFKAILFACLCIAVLSVNGHRQQMSRQPQGHQRRGNSLNRPQDNANRQNGPNQSHNRMIRQLPSMPGMNPAEIPQLMADGVQKGIGVMTNMMNPGKWMQAASQMIPKSDSN